MAPTRTFVIMVAALGGVGCEQWHAPERVSALEKRVNELSATVSVLAGRPVGAGLPEVRSGAGAELGGAPRPDGDGGVAAATAGAPPGGAGPADPVPAPKVVTDWSYEGENGPDVWGAINPAWATCGEGRDQSPIEISPRASNATPIEFRYQPVAARIVDTGAMMRINFAPGSSISIDGRPYELVEAHVHTPSEHVIAGEHFPMELQLVHRDAGGKTAIVGVLYDVGAESSPLSSVWAKWPAKPNLEVEVRKPVDPNGFLPDTRTVYRYNGSLTTPPCTEGVQWNVMRRPMTDSRRHLELLRLRYTSNARPLQPLNDRDVL